MDGKGGDEIRAGDWVEGADVAPEMVALLRKGAGNRNQRGRPSNAWVPEA
jgi:hypothetical protein